MVASGSFNSLWTWWFGNLALPQIIIFFTASDVADDTLVTVIVLFNELPVIKLMKYWAFSFIFLLERQ